MKILILRKNKVSKSIDRKIRQQTQTVKAICNKIERTLGYSYPQIMVHVSALYSKKSHLFFPSTFNYMPRLVSSANGAEVNFLPTVWLSAPTLQLREKFLTMILLHEFSHYADRSVLYYLYSPIKLARVGLIDLKRDISIDDYQKARQERIVTTILRVLIKDSNLIEKYKNELSALSSALIEKHENWFKKKLPILAIEDLEKRFINFCKKICPTRKCYITIDKHLVNHVYNSLKKRYDSIFCI